MQVASGMPYQGKCTHCGNTRMVRVFNVSWPDKKQMLERLCATCEPVWGANLIRLGCTLSPEPRTGPATTLGAGAL